MRDRLRSDPSSSDSSDPPTAGLDEALREIARIAGVRQAYAQLVTATHPTTRVAALACDERDIERIRAFVGSDEIRRALARGATVNTRALVAESTLQDPSKVRELHAPAVLCIPLGRRGSRARSRQTGLVYLQGRDAPGPFPDDVQARVEQRCAELCALPLPNERGSERTGATPDDPTEPYREALDLEGVIGRSPAMARVFRRLRSASAIDRLQVLLTGENGTGKSMLARVIHRNGSRCEGPFVQVNCAAIPADLFEAEFFGCAKGAYTEARERPGRFAAATGGTLFLDEVGEIPLAQQAKLLRVLDEGCYERLGEDRTRRADVRIIAATNRDLERAVEAGTFRRDLYFRLNRYRIRVPSLAERRADVRELAQACADRECRNLGLEPVLLGERAVRLLETHDWPGNVRELESTIAEAVLEAHADSATEVGPQHVFAEDSDEVEREAEPSASPESCADMTWNEATREFQRRFLEAQLQHEDWNVARVARRLDLARSHLYNLIDSFGFERPGRRREREGASGGARIARL